MRATLRALWFASAIVGATASLRAQSRGRAVQPRQAAASTPAPDTIVAEPVALWDSLYDRGAYFELRDRVAGWNAPETSITRYARGLIAQAFNDPDQAISLLQPLSDNANVPLTPLQRRRMTIALGQSYLREYRYRESGEVYAAAIRSSSSSLDPATRARFRSAASLGNALRNVLPQRVVWERSAALDSVASGGGRFVVSGSIDGSPTGEPFDVRATARLSMLDSATAATYHVHMLDSSIVLPSSIGTPVVARIGVLSTLAIGPVVVSNVVVLVVPHEELPSSGDSADISGIIGFPVVRAIGRVAFTSDGHIALSSPGVAPVDSTAGAPLALLDSPMLDIVPLVEASVRGRGVALAWSAHAERTVLVTAQAGDSSAGLIDSSVTPDSLPEEDIGIGGRTVRLAARAIPAAPGLAPPGAAGILGADVLQRVDALVLDFDSMSARLVTRPTPPVLPIISYSEAPSAAPAPSSVPRELIFIALLFALFIVPKALQRYGIPGAITALIMGGVANAFGLFPDDPTLRLLSTLGIVALFLFAGLEIDGPELRRNVSALTLHAAIWAALATAMAVVTGMAFGLSSRAAALFSLALVTPSTGFILSSLASFGMSDAECRAVKTYAIGSELLALAALFFVLQSTSLGHLALAIAAIAGVVLFIPLAFRFFSAVVAPYAPRSEFAFLLMVAVVSAYATRRLGVYYLVGAFLVGVAAQRFRGDHPAMSSERMVNALEAFGSVFIPFYFFHAGTEIARDQLTWKALLLGIAFTVAVVPIRVGVVTLHRRFVLGEHYTDARRVASALVPTLVFTLVIVAILHEHFNLPNDLAGALVLYTILNTTLPALLLRAAPADFEDHVAPQANAPAASD